MDVVQPSPPPGPAAGRTPGPGAWLAAVAMLLLVAGCRREEVTSYRIAKNAPPPAGAPAADPMGAAHRPAAPPPPGMAGEVPPPPTPSAAEALKWTLPSGWAQSFPGGMRYATFKVPGTGKIDGSVVTLPGDAGGDLSNVNRWRGQIGLGPTDGAGLAAARTTVKTRAGLASVYDFTSDGGRKSRLIAAILVVDGSSWFIKLTGDAEPVGAARPAFFQLLESLHRD
jgi:hypothetical protein